MRPHIETETIALPARTVYRIENGRGLRVACLTGNTWITQANDRRDIVLTPGDAFILDRPGIALVMALKDAAITTSRPSVPERLAA